MEEVDMTRYALDAIEIADARAAHQEIRRRLREVGLLIEPQGPPDPEDAEEVTLPIRTTGQPGSEIIKEDRQTR